MKFFTNKYMQAQLWKDALALREEKKQGSPIILPTIEVSEKKITPVAIQPEIVFTQADKGHNAEEAQKIQNLYGKIKELGFRPSFAGV